VGEVSVHRLRSSCFPGLSGYDGQPDLPSGSHLELPDGGHHDYLV
jgi:hypothetical protein